MYIAFESLPGNDPRIDNEIKKITQWWHYTIAEVPDNKHIVWLSPVTLSKEETKADILCDAINDELSVRKSVAKRGELRGYSGDDEEADDKIIHILTEKEKSIAVSFMRKIISNFAEKQLSSLKEVAMIKKKVQQAKTIKECKIIMKNYFDYNCGSVSNYEDLKTTLESWKNPEIVSLLPKEKTV